MGGELLPLEGDLTEHNEQEQRYFDVWNVLLLLGVCSITILRSKYGHMLPNETSFFSTGLLQRYLSVFQNFLALTMSWTLFRETDWYWRSQIHNRTMAKAINAFVVTVVAVV